jgi:hypothetical protein
MGFPTAVFGFVGVFGIRMGLGAFVADVNDGEEGITYGLF